MARSSCAGPCAASASSTTRTRCRRSSSSFTGGCRSMIHGIAFSAGWRGSSSARRATSGARPPRREGRLDRDADLAALATPPLDAGRDRALVLALFDELEPVRRSVLALHLEELTGEEDRGGRRDADRHGLQRARAGEGASSKQPGPGSKLASAARRAGWLSCRCSRPISSSSSRPTGTSPTSPTTHASASGMARREEAGGPCDGRRERQPAAPSSQRPRRGRDRHRRRLQDRGGLCGGDRARLLRRRARPRPRAWSPPRA